MDSPFVNLHTYSHYSLLSALPKIPELVGRAKELQMPALALVDCNNLYGAVEFYKKCTENDITPILGVTLSVVPESGGAALSGEGPAHLVLLARDNAGYQNLVKLVSEAHLHSALAGDEPAVSDSQLREHAHGLIALSGARGGEIPELAAAGQHEQALERVHFYQDTFGAENFYLELFYEPESVDQTQLWDGLSELSEQTGAPLVAAKEIAYLSADDKTAYNALRGVGGVSEADRVDRSFLSQEAAQDIFADHSGAIQNTKEIAERCHVEFEFGNWIFPEVDLSEGVSAEARLRELVYAGIETRQMERTQEVIDRIEYELNIIETKGYSPYFLVVGDILNEAHRREILTSIRGSVAGSLITYLLGITNLDPIEYKLAFERFLNPDRPSPPDIDMDFADDRRDEMLEYARSKYGEDKLAQIGTFGTMAARGAVRDIARALGYPYSIGDKIARLIPFGAQGFPMTIDRALEEVPELVELYESEDEAEQIIDMAKKVEGCARHISVHAAGVVISPKPLSELVPLQPDPKGGKLITQYDMHAVEDVGLTKFDFLGIRNLSILSKAMELAKEFYDTDVDIEDIPLDDPATFELLSAGKTVGLFQLGGTGMTRYLMELKPTTIHDINAMVALYRPGPMEFIPEYIRRKKDPTLVDYPHPALEEDLKLSYGLLIYQEDVMMSAIKLASYSWLEADKFRKAMGKKIPELMAEQEEKFKSGCQANGMEKKNVDELWENIKPFASYAFNKAHSASYGRVAYQTAYMKANFPAAYMTAILSAESGDTEKIAEIVAECARMDLPVLAPSVNESEGDFTIVAGADGAFRIRFGLYTIKNLGEGIAQAIVAERKENGTFSSFENLLRRVDHKDLQKSSLEALVNSGAMDELGERGQMRANIEKAVLFLREKNSLAQSAQGALFGESEAMASFVMGAADPMSFDEKLGWEKQLLGLYISGHPLDKFQDWLQSKGVSIGKVKKESHPEMTVRVAGLLKEVKPIMTKKGDRMAFLKLADTEDALELVAFPEVFKKNGEMLTPEVCIAVEGKYSERGGDPSVIVEKVKVL